MASVSGTSLAATTGSRPRRILYRWRSDLICSGFLVLLMLGAFPGVVFAGRTLSVHQATAGVNGFEVAADAPAFDFSQRYQVDAGASSWQFQPWAEINSRALSDGDLPLWNPYQGAGTPHAANMQSAVFDPLLLPMNLHPTPLVADISFLAAFVLGTLAMYGFARVLRLRPLAAVTGAAAFSLSGYFFLYSNNHFARSYIYLPVLFMLVELVLRSPRWFPVGGLGCATAANLVVGMPEASLIVIGSAGAYGVLRVVADRSESATLPRCVRLGGGFALGFVVASPLLLLFGEYVANSHHLHSPGHRKGAATDPIRTMLNWVVPLFNGMPVERGGAAGTSGVRNWTGSATLVLALAGLSARRPSTRQYHPWIFALLGGLMVLKIYDFGVFNWVSRMPVLERVNFPAFGTPLVAFCAAVLAAVGVEMAITRQVRLVRFATLMVGGLIGIAALVRQPDVRELIAATDGAWALRQFGLPAVVGTAGALIVLLGRRFARPGAVGALVVIELLALSPRHTYAPRADPFAQPPWMDVLQRSSRRHPYSRVIGLDAKLFPNTAAAFSLYDVRTLDALYPTRYWRYVTTFLAPSAHDRFVGGPYASAETRLDADRLEMLDLLGVRYVVAGSGALARQPTPLTRRVASSITESPTLRLTPITVGDDGRWAIFEHPDQEVDIGSPDASADELAFSYTIDARAFDDAHADGVEFSIVSRDDSGRRRVLWSDVFVPREDPVTPTWLEVSVPIDPSRDRHLSLVTGQRGNAGTDWAGWADLEYRPANSPDTSDSPPTNLRLLGGAENAWVYENEGVLPRAFVVHDVHVTSDEEATLKFFEDVGERDQFNRLIPKRFDPRVEAVIEAEGMPPNDFGARRRDCSGATSEITTYEPQRVVVDVTSPCNGLLVLSDTYFPGWTATVGGEAAHIYPTDLALRGVAVPSGRTRVVFRYEPAGVQRGVILAFLGFGLFIGVAVHRAVRTRRAGLAR